MSEAFRAFIALPLPDAVRDHLASVQRCMSGKGVRARWVQPAGMHLTIKFLGQMPLEKKEGVMAVLDQAVTGCAPLQLTAAGLGGFPNRRRPRVLWMGLGGEVGRLRTLQETVETGLSNLGWAKEKRPFQGHLTLGRAKGRRPMERDTADILLRCEPREALAFETDSLVLYRSRLQPQGAVHDKISAWILNAPAH
jgi:2'-5' RNA ligase